MSTPAPPERTPEASDTIRDAFIRGVHAAGSYMANSTAIDADLTNAIADLAPDVVPLTRYEEAIAALRAAVGYIEASPCDPDITAYQRERWRRYQEAEPHAVLAKHDAL